MYQISLPGGLTVNNPDRFKFGKGSSPAGIVMEAMPIFMSIVGIILFLLFVFGGFTMLTSAGNPEGVKKGQGMIVNALIGFVIIFVAYWIMQFLQIALGVNLGFGA
jgi:Zn-dependent protease with chaperone function